MFYYPFHISDYRSATAHLTNGEDLAYRRLLDLYYDTEGAIHGDAAKLARLVRSAQVDVETVLGEFFRLSDGHYHHGRCDRELAEMFHRAEVARANGGKGGRPRKQITQWVSPAIPELTQVEPKPNPDESYPSTPVPQHPSTPKEEKAPRKRVAPVAVEKPEDVRADIWDSWLVVRQSKRARLTTVVMEAMKREADKAGWTLEAAIRECAERNWQAFKAEWVSNKTIPFQSRPPVGYVSSNTHIQNTPLGSLMCQCNECVKFREKRGIRGIGGA